MCFNYTKKRILYFALLIPKISAAQIFILDQGLLRGLVTDNDKII
jgi:hypothetical protein